MNIKFRDVRRNTTLWQQEGLRRGPTSASRDRCPTRSRARRVAPARRRAVEIGRAHRGRGGGSLLAQPPRSGPPDGLRGFLSQPSRPLPPVALLARPRAVPARRRPRARHARAVPRPAATSRSSREVLDARDAGVERHRAGRAHPAVARRRTASWWPRASTSSARGRATRSPRTSRAESVHRAGAARRRRRWRRRHWLAKAVPARARDPVAAPAGGQLVAWLRARARADGLELTEEAATLLVELAGDDLTHLRGELEKAALAGGRGEPRASARREVRAVVGEHARAPRLRSDARARGAAIAAPRSTLLGSLLGGRRGAVRAPRHARRARRARSGAPPTGSARELPEAEIARGARPSARRARRQ